MPDGGIPATRPTVLPAVPERVYDRWAIAEISVAGTGIGADTTSGYVRWRKYRVLSSGAQDLGPADEVLTMPLGDLYALAAQYPAVAQALEAFVAAAAQVAQARGLL